MNIAIIAHFDDQGRLSENFLNLLQCLQFKFNRMVVVSTSDVEGQQLANIKNIKLIKRPNFGYDFYSYKVGILSLESIHDIDKLFFINSSFTIVNQDLFQASINRMLDLLNIVSVVGVTESNQFSWHLQSYLLGFNRAIIQSTWFDEFIRGIEPKNDKNSIIFDYEIGLSTKIKERKYKYNALFKPSIFQIACSQYRCLLNNIKNGNIEYNIYKYYLNIFRNINPIHFYANQIADRFGIIKNELIKKNPNNIKLKRKYIPYLLNEKSNEYVESSPNNICIPFKSCCYGKKNGKIAVLIHIYYLDVLDEIMDGLDSISDPYDLYITTPYEGAIPIIFAKSIKSTKFISIHIFENRGRDIGPFFSLFISGIFDNYLAVLKLHTKKSVYSNKGDEWRRLLLKKTIGNPIQNRKIIEAFKNSFNGIIGPDEYFLTNKKYWGANFDVVQKIISDCKLLESGKKCQLGFFAGSMFWFSPKSLEALKRITNSNLIFEKENGKQDGTLAHALERVFCIAARLSGHKIMNINFVEVNEYKSLKNTVPVL